MSFNEEVILETGNVRVRILILDSGEATDWHFHSEVTDRMLCLEGRIAIECQGPQERVELSPGGRCNVSVHRVHRVVNLTDGAAKYLLVQGGGSYDFNTVKEATLQ